MSGEIAPGPNDAPPPARHPAGPRCRSANAWRSAGFGPLDLRGLDSDLLEQRAVRHRRSCFGLHRGRRTARRGEAGAADLVGPRRGFAVRGDEDVAHPVVACLCPQRYELARPLRRTGVLGRKPHARDLQLRAPAWRRAGTPRHLPLGDGSSSPPTVMSARRARCSRAARWRTWFVHRRTAGRQQDGAREGEGHAGGPRAPNNQGSADLVSRGVRCVRLTPELQLRANH